MLHSHLNTRTLFPNIITPLRHRYHHHSHYPSPLLFPSHTPTSLPPLRTHQQWLSQLPETTPDTPVSSQQEQNNGDAGGGPIELLPSSTKIFALTDEPTPLQVATSVLLTGAISVFLFRSIRRRAKRAKELKFRSSGAKKTLKEEALDSLKAIASNPVDAKKPPSPVQALLGGISAGVIALILYKFTTTIEAALNRQTVPDSFSVRQITITIRTILNGLCYLATFVFGINSVGLFLYSAQLAVNSFMEGSNSEESKESSNPGSQNSTSEGATDSVELNSSQGESRDEIQQ